MNTSTGTDGGRSYEHDQEALSDAYAAARGVRYASGSPEMVRLEHAEAHRGDFPNPNAESGGDEPPTDPVPER